MAARRRFLRGLAALLLALPLPLLASQAMTTHGAGAGKAHETGFLDRTAVVDGVSYRYQVFVPDDWTPDRRWPVLLFLHGSGERGDDGLRQTLVGLPQAIRADRARFPMLVVMPQARADTRWTGAMAAQAMRALEQTITEFRGDRDRLLLTGLSIGGQGAWLLAADHPGTFAAIAPVAGFLRLKLDDDVRDPAIDAALLAHFPEVADADGDADATAKAVAAFAPRIGRVPAWIFHGDADDLVPPAQARALANALRARGSGELRYTECAGGNHNAWDAAYADPGLVPWLLAQRRREDGPGR